MSGEATGAPVGRIDGVLKVTGNAHYASDIRIPGIVYGVLICSTIAKGHIVEIEEHQARSLPGVIDIITHRNIPPFPPAQIGEFPLLLQDNSVQHQGQPLAILIADTLERAKYASSYIKIRYEQEQAITTLEANIANTFAPSTIDGNVPDSVRGDPVRGLGEAEVQIVQTYTTPMEHHNPMEPHAALAIWNGDSVTVYTSTQGVYATRTAIAKALGIPVEQVRVISPFLGGGFGSKGRAWMPGVILAVIAAQYVGRPVKLELTRAHMFTIVGNRPRTLQQITLGATQGGQLTTLVHTTIAQSSTTGEYADPNGFVSRMLYACPNVAISHRLVRVNAPEPTAMRAPGEGTGTFALESALDELAYALSLDPIEVRLRNYAEKDPHTGRSWSSNSLRECYRLGAETFGWMHRPPLPRSLHDGNRLIGWGMATATYPTFRASASAHARIFADGTALVQSATQDLGTGIATILTQIAADAFGLPMHKVRVELGDTLLPEAPKSIASMTTASVAPAVQTAAINARKQIIALACTDGDSPLYNLHRDSIDVENGRLFSRGDKHKGETYAQILTRHDISVIDADGSTQVGDDQNPLCIESDNKTLSKEKSNQFSTHAFGAHFAEVRVDPDLGEVRVTRFVGAYGAGRILNPKTARSQQIGGIIFGIGMALLEETRIDCHYGRITNDNLAEYLLPVHGDVPAIEVLFVDESDPDVNEVGAKGIGMLGTVGTAAAIANAVFHATGKRLRDLPITLDKLL